MKHLKHMLILVLMVVMLTSVLAIPAAALSPTWNDYFYNNFPEQRVGYYHYGYTSAIQRFLYVNPTTQSDITSSGGIDGMFGNGTKNAVTTFQEECADEPGCPTIPTSEIGKVGKNTWKAIAFMMYEVYPTGYEDWYQCVGNKRVIKADYSTKQLKYYISDSTVGGLITSFG